MQNTEDILALAKEEGYELNDDELNQIAGGSWGGDDTPAIVCPNCGSGSFWMKRDGCFSSFS